MEKACACDGQAPEALIPRLQLLVACNEYTSAPSRDGSIDIAGVQKSGARIMLMAETRTPPVTALDPLCTTIQVRSRHRAYHPSHSCVDLYVFQGH
jgi:hypothetical protein